MRRFYVEYEAFCEFEQKREVGHFIAEACDANTALELVYIALSNSDVVDEFVITELADIH